MNKNTYSGFHDCPLDTVYLGRNLSYKTYPFNDKRTLKSIIIGNNVNKIGENEFNGCTGLESVTIGNSVTVIGKSAFSGCKSITSITIPNSVTSIGESAFSGCKSITSITIPNSVTSIGESAFSGCESITSITIPNSVITIKKYTFQNCKSLTNIIIPNSVTDIEDYAFRLCSGLKHIIFEDGTEELLLNKNTYSGFYDCPLDTVYLGRNLSYKTYPFKGKRTLKSIIIGNNVNKIGENEFNGCTGLESVTIGNSVTSIGGYAFYGCSGLTSVTIGNGVTSIGGYAFYGCKSLTNIIIPNSVTDIEDYAFRGCSGLKHIIFEDGTEELILNKNTYSGFHDCPLDTVYLGRNLSYKDYPFKDKRTLKSIIIGNNVNKIGENEFNGCTGLESVTIGNSVTVIGKFAFGNCENVTEIVCHALVPPVCDTKALADIDKQNCSLTVPYKSAYKAAEQWKDFLNIKGTYTEKFTVTFIVDGEVYDTLSVEYGEKITLPETPVKEGHTFSGWSEVPETMPAEDITIEGTFSVNSYTITYKVDGEVYATDSIAYGSEIVLRDEPTKEGHTFSGWSEAPETMPAEDITIEGTFSVNSYTITYKVDGEVYATDSIAYGSEIVLRDEPAKEGHTFSGWSEVPETMPAEDITITGSFEVNTYAVTYIVDGEVYATDSVAYGSEIVLRDEPAKEGHTFSGWSEVPETMPAEDIVIEGRFSVNSYTITYKVDGEVYETVTAEYGTAIELIEEPIKEGHTFSGWSDVPETMPAEDITVEGTFSINSYTVTFIIDGEVYETTTVEFGAKIELPTPPEKEGYIFSGWVGVPDTMPAEDIVIEGEYIVDTTGINDVKAENGKVKGVYDLQGRKVDNPTNGIYIINGKKTLIK